MGAVGLIEKRVLLDASGVAQVLDRLATEVAGLVAHGPSAVIGIQTGGVHVARRILDRLAARGTPLPSVGTLDITLYRDDIGMTREQPQVRRTDIPFELSRTGVVLVDDVLFTGRTVRAALDALVDFGRPRFIRLAVLVDRGFREYPIQADCIGLRADTEPAERVQVELVETGAPADRVVVYERRA